MSYNKFLAPVAQILPYSIESEAITIPQMVCRNRIFITCLKNNGIKQLEFSQCLTKLLPGYLFYFLNLSRAFTERQQILTFPSATEDEGKVRTGKCENFWVFSQGNVCFGGIKLLKQLCK